jgi:putative membrane protein
VRERRWYARVVTASDHPLTPQWLVLGVRLLINIAALWTAQALVRGFDIDSAGALVFGAAIFGVINAVIRPIVVVVSCAITVLTLGFFLLIVNTLMLALTAWTAGLFDLAFHVDGFTAAFLGALVVSAVSLVLSAWGDRHILRPTREPAWLDFGT